MALTIEDVKKRLLANPHVASVECTPVAYISVTMKPGCVRDERFTVYAIEQEILREYDGLLDFRMTTRGTQTDVCRAYGKLPV